MIPVIITSQKKIAVIFASSEIRNGPGTSPLIAYINRIHLVKDFKLALRNKTSARQKGLRGIPGVKK